MEKKLEAYRAQKRKEENVNKIKEKIKTFFTLPSAKIKYENLENDISNIPTTKACEQQQSDCDDSIASETDDEIIIKCSYMDWLYYMLVFVLWLTLFAIFIQLQFGMVYFLISGLIAMYLNTRTGPRKGNEVSAYSVFNKNCESIDGTLKAEQFEREIRYGPANIR